jgi:hypothetical protein
VVAIKIIDLEEAEDEIEDIQQEITILSQVPFLSHPCACVLVWCVFWEHWLTWAPV